LARPKRRSTRWRIRRRIKFKSLPPVAAHSLEISLKSGSRIPRLGFRVTDYYAAILVGADDFRVASQTQRTEEPLSLRICIPDRPIRRLSKPQDEQYCALGACEPTRREPLASRLLKLVVADLYFTVGEANLPVGFVRSW
jgi:hypothetical protein